MKAKCLQCGKKPAKELFAEGRSVYCSLRCAAHRGIEAAMDLQWCPICKVWFNTWEEMSDHEPHLKV